MAYSDKVWKNAPDYTTPLSAAGLNDWEARIKAETDALEVLAATKYTVGDVLPLPVGSAAAPGATFSGDTDTGMYRVSANRLGFSTAGVARAYFNTDGAFIVADTANGDPMGLTSGTAAGSIVSGYNRFYRTINAAQTGTIRLLGANSSDEVTLLSDGAEGGPNASLVFRTSETQFYRSGTKVLGLTSAGAAVAGTFSVTDAVSLSGAVTGSAAADTNTMFVGSKLAGDSTNQLEINYNGKLRWGAGGGSGVDTDLYRDAAGVLRTSGTVRIDGALRHGGSTAGFYGTTPIAKQTGVAVTDAAIHAALVALGLIAA